MRASVYAQISEFLFECLVDVRAKQLTGERALIESSHVRIAAVMNDYSPSLLHPKLMLIIGCIRGEAAGRSEWP